MPVTKKIKLFPKPSKTSADFLRRQQFKKAKNNA